MAKDQDATSQSKQQTATIRQIQTQIIDAVLLVGGIVGFVGVLAVITIVSQLGWQGTSISSGIVLLMVVLAGLFRHRLPYVAKTLILVSAFYLTAIINILGWGLVGGSSVWFVLTVLLTMILHDMRTGLLVYGGVVVTIIIVTLLFQFEVVIYTIDFEAYATDIESWVAWIVMIVIVCAMLVASAGRLIEVLRSQLLHSQQVARDLETRTQDLIMEIQKREGAEAALASALQELKQLDGLKDQFIDSVSHELRTPIANIQLYHQLLGMKPEKARQYLDTLTAETARLSYIVEQMIHASSDSYDMELTTMVDVDVLQVAVRYLEDYQDTITSKSLTLDVQDPENAYVTLAGPEHIGRAIGNVIDNATKYAVDNSEIRVHAERVVRGGHAYVLLTVSNISEGAQPTETEQSAIFERFYRGETSLKMGVPGAGLGLPISKQIIEQYGGSIELSTDPIEDERHQLTFTLAFHCVTPLEQIVNVGIQDTP